MYTEPSPPAVTSRRSFLSKHMAVSLASPCAFMNRPSLCPLVMFHTHTVPLSSAVTTTPNVWLYSTPRTASMWPVRSCATILCTHTYGRFMAVMTRLCSESYTRQCGRASSGRFQSSCVMVCRQRWLRRSHTLMTLSALSVNTWFRRVSRLMCVTLAVWPVSSPMRRTVLPCHRMTSRSRPHDANIEYAEHHTKPYTALVWCVQLLMTFSRTKS
mmetsp:Transcript_22304/g.56749  ORF Transcript_22304/g.56749 Transcript_22304/m.56749 type:complete len:214 (-) Transcript_22304:1041-1682(-)